PGRAARLRSDAPAPGKTRVPAQDGASGAEPSAGCQRRPAWFDLRLAKPAVTPRVCTARCCASPAAAAAAVDAGREGCGLVVSRITEPNGLLPRELMGGSCDVSRPV